MVIPGPFASPFVLRYLQRELRADPDMLRRFQNERLRALVRHAGMRVPFYRRLYGEAGVDVRAFRGLEDLWKLPEVTRADLQQTPERELVAEGVEPATLVAHRSSGTTGTPILVRRSRAEELFLQSIRVRAMMAIGLRPWQRRARIAFPWRRHPQSVGPVLGGHSRGWLFPYRLFDAASDPARMAEVLAAYRPSLLGGHPTFLERLCTLAPSDVVASIRPRLVVCGGESLLPSTRVLLERTLGAPVHDFYGTFEFNLVGWQREAGGEYEVPGVNMLVEAASASAEDPVGELIGTSLHSRVAPIIRSHLGDQVEVAERDPESGLAISLRRVAGRVTDRFVTRDGQSMHAYEVVEPMMAPPLWAQSYRIEQHSPGDVLVRVMLIPGISPAETAEGIRRLRADLASRVNVDIEIVDSLPPEESGKRRLFVRTIPLPEATRAEVRRV